MDFLNTVITTPRLRLVPIEESFAPLIFAEITPDITPFMRIDPPKKISETLTFIQSSRKKMEKGTDFVVSIFLKDTHEFIGGSGVHHLETGTPELGIWIKKSAHGRRYGKETVGALIGWASKHFSVEYFRYEVDKKNIPSQKIATSLGGKYIGEAKETTTSGKVLDKFVFAIYPQQ